MLFDALFKGVHTCVWYFYECTGTQLNTTRWTHVNLSLRNVVAAGPPPTCTLTVQFL